MSPFLTYLEKSGFFWHMLRRIRVQLVIVQLPLARGDECVWTPQNAYFVCGVDQALPNFWLALFPKTLYY